MPVLSFNSFSLNFKFLVKSICFIFHFLLAIILDSFEFDFVYKLICACKSVYSFIKGNKEISIFSLG